MTSTIFAIFCLLEASRRFQPQAVEWTIKGRGLIKELDLVEIDLSMYLSQIEKQKSVYWGMLWE